MFKKQNDEKKLTDKEAQALYEDALREMGCDESYIDYKTGE